MNDNRSKPRPERRKHGNSVPRVSPGKWTIAIGDMTTLLIAAVVAACATGFFALPFTMPGAAFGAWDASFDLEWPEPPEEQETQLVRH